jgi:hypothetical protein
VRTRIALFRGTGQKPFLLIFATKVFHTLNLGIATGFNHTRIDEQTPSFVMGRKPNSDEKSLSIRRGNRTAKSNP